MGSIVAENRKSLMLFSGRGFPELAEEIGQVLGVAPTPMDAYEFANGEIFVRFKESVRGSRRVRRAVGDRGVNRWVMESLIMVDALKRGSAKRITVVLPFYPYAAAGQEAPRPGADLGPADRGPVQDGGRRTGS